MHQSSAMHDASLKTVCPLLLTSHHQYAFWHTWFAPQNLPYSATFSGDVELPTHEALQPADGCSSLARSLLTSDTSTARCQGPVCGVPINGSPNRPPPHVPATHPLHDCARTWQAPTPSPTMLAVADRHAHAGRDGSAVQARPLDGAPETSMQLASCNGAPFGLPTARVCL